MIIKRRPLPDHPDYIAACQQMSTLYNVYDKPDKTKGYHMTQLPRTRIEGARSYPISATGMMAQSSGLCVIPLDQGGPVFVYPHIFKDLSDKTGYWTVQKKDKVMPGVGPEVNTSMGWNAISANNYPDCFMIQKIEYHKSLSDNFVHIEVKPG